MDCTEQLITVFRCTKTEFLQKFIPHEMPLTNPKQPSSSIRGLQRAVQELMNVPTFAATATATATATGISSCKENNYPYFLLNTIFALSRLHSHSLTVRRRRATASSARGPQRDSPTRASTWENSLFEQIRTLGTKVHIETGKWLITAEKMVEGSDRKWPNECPKEVLTAPNVQTFKLNELARRSLSMPLENCKKKIEIR